MEKRRRKKRREEGVEWKREDKRRELRRIEKGRGS